MRPLLAASFQNELEKIALTRADAALIGGVSGLGLFGGGLMVGVSAQKRRQRLHDHINAYAAQKDERDRQKAKEKKASLDKIALSPKLRFRAAQKAHADLSFLREAALSRGHFASSFQNKQMADAMGRRTRQVVNFATPGVPIKPNAVDHGSAGLTRDLLHKEHLISEKQLPRGGDLIRSLVAPSRLTANGF